MDDPAVQLNKVLMECVRADGLKAANPIMKQINKFSPDKYSEVEYMMTTLMVSMAHQIQALMIMVENLSRTVSERITEGAPPGVTTNQPNDSTPKSYAKATAQAPQSAMPTAQVKGKRKAEAGPTPRMQSTMKLIKKTQEQPRSDQPKGNNNSQKPT